MYDNIKITYEYTALNGEPIRGNKICRDILPCALELFADLDVDYLPTPDLTKPYTLTIITNHNLT